ncbi:MAG: class I SAM-dependent methyltransferase [Candidatus Obscuribacterales bacterium]|nr:class I SAM-dependent methyltransferase [Candidatus Obscuribacterales bacterium]
MISPVQKLADSKQRFLLSDVAFYGRTLNEYVEMFNFNPDEWEGKRVLDCASGPASFAAEAHQAGIKAVACDPMYVHSAADLINRAEKDIELCLSKTKEQRELFDLSTCEKDTHYVAEKQRALFNFSRDYSTGKEQGRYINGSLPHLPFPDNRFDLVLSAHLLFVYATKDNGGLFNEERFPLSFHIEAIKEMIRVSSHELRIYPLKGPNRSNHALLSAVLETLQKMPVEFELVDVSYKDIAAATQMLKIKKLSGV